MNALKKIGRYLLSEHLIWVLLVVLCVFGFFVRGFFTPRNMMNILWSAAPLGCMVLGMFFVMVVAGTDLSLESTLGFAPTIAIMFMITWAPNLVTPGIAIVLTLIIGLIVGFVNGLISVRLRVNPFLVTLATMLVMRGATIFLIPEGVYYLPDGYTFLGNFRINGFFPIAVIVLIVLYLIAYFITNHFTFGKNMYAVGNNPEAAYVAGINVDKVKITTFIIAGLVAAIGGIIEVGRLSSVVADLGEGDIMMVFAGTILGGTSMAGGRGKISGIFGAVLVLAIIDNILNLFGIDPSIRKMVYGLILLLAIYLASMQLKPKAAETIEVAEAVKATEAAQP